MSDVTRILNAIQEGNTRAADELLSMVYEELRRWLPRSCRRKIRGRHYKQLLWCMKPIFG